MTWRDHLLVEELSDLDSAESRRDGAKAAFNKFRATLKNRAEARIRRGAADESSLHWQDFLSSEEAEQLERAEEDRNNARAEFNRIRARLKNRGEARHRRDLRRAARADG